MGKHQRATPVIRLLARLGWQRDPNLWAVRCRDGRGRRARLRVHLTEDGITLIPSSPGPWALTPLEAGRLRAAVRDALLNFDRLAGTEYHDAPPGARSTQLASTRPDPAARQRVRLEPPTRPSAAEIASRVAVPTTPPLEASHDRPTDKPAHHTLGTPVAA